MIIRLVIFALLTLGVVGAGEPVSVDKRLSGGETTTFLKNANAFGQPLANISRESRRDHSVGNSFFNKNWVTSPASTKARDGLGPFFHAASCSGCHTKDGRGAPPQNGELMTGLLFRLSIPGKGAHGESLPDPNFGGQLGVRAIPGVEAEGDVRIVYQEVAGTYADGTAYSLRKPTYTLETNAKYGDVSPDVLVSPRVAPPVFGVGLLEAIPEFTIRAMADPDDTDKDGISGRVNLVWNGESEEIQLGRFGWKANEPSVRLQTAGAFLGDMGITSSIHQHQDYTPSQAAYVGDLPTGDEDGEPEISDKLLNQVVTYQKTLAPPARRDVDQPEIILGEKLFAEVNCTACHVPSLKTGDSDTLPELANQLIQPFTDLLIHDMGEDLADHRPDGEASGTEWRTPPLWGIGLTEVVNGHTNFLHDGRARNIEEAILWHGGESEGSVEAYKALSAKERAALLSFLKSL